MENRRDFLKKSCGVLSMAALATQMNHFGLISALAQENDEASPDGNSYKALVCVFLSGGNDSNNMVIPNYNAGYADYAASRQGEGLAIPRNQLLPITPSSMGGQIYGLHPAMTGLHELWQQNKVAVACNVGTLVEPMTRAQYQSNSVPRPQSLFSHNNQREQFKTAISTYSSTTGWGGRLSDRVAGQNVGASIPMISQLSSGANVFSAGNGSSPLIIAPSPTPLNQVLVLNGFGTSADEIARRTAMDRMRQENLNYSMIQEASTLTQRAINVSQQLSQNPTLTVTFPTTSIGNQLSQVAKLMKFRTQLNMNRQVFYVEIGGFDTHSGQLNQQNRLLSEVSQAIRAFYDETVAQGIASQVTTFTLSDFNRTFDPAGSGGNSGSDHAWGGHHLIVGGAVAGGNFYGRPTSNGTYFPTLVNAGPDDAISRGIFIPTVPVELYAATLARWFGLNDNDIPFVFPNINTFGSTNLGFMR